MSPELAMVVAVGLPLLGAAVILATDAWPDLRDGLGLLVSVATFGAVATLVGPVAAGARPAVAFVDLFPGVPLAFRLEPLGLLYALVASGLWPITHVYAVGYMRGHHEANQTRFFACFALSIAAALGIAFSANLVTLFAFYEALTLSTFPLVTHHGTPDSVRAGRVYLGLLLTTSVSMLLLGIAWVYAIAGHGEFTPGGVLMGKATGETMALIAGLFFFGTGKAALMPFHRWLPNAMVAPTPVSALLHAVAVVKAGVFTVLKITVYIFGLEYLALEGATAWLQVAAAFTLIAASVIALTQDNLKARLAYSTISQLAYIVLAAALATPHAVVGGAMHIAMHAVGKITLFFCAGAIYVGAHKTRVSELDGIGRRMPFTMGAFAVASLSIIGLPPAGGVASKWFMALGAVDAGAPWAAGVYMVSSLLSIGYLVPIVTRAFFRPVPRGGHEHGEGPLLTVVAPVVTAAGCVVLFALAGPLYDLLVPLVEAVR